jgi:hypothetical protein
VSRREGQDELRAFLDRARRRWRTVVLVRGMLLGAVLAAIAILTLGAVDSLGLVPTGLRPLLRWLPLPIGLLPVARSLVLALLQAPGHHRLALRLEEANPEWEHLPSALLDLGPDHPFAPNLSQALGSRLPSIRLHEVTGRWIGPGEGTLGALCVSGAVLLLSLIGGPGETWARWGAPPGGGAATPDAIDTAGDEEADPLERLLAGFSIRVSPPPYTGMDEVRFSVREPVRALEGSRIRISGETPDGSRLELRLIRPGEDARTLAALAPGRVDQPHQPRDGGAQLPRSSPGPWSAEWTLAADDRALLLSLEDGERIRERVVPLEPVPDPPPTVELLEPASDMVLATGSGEVRFRARASDPFGVDDFALTWVHTRGSGESFDFREGRRSWSSVEQVGEEIEGTLTLRLDDLELGPGEVLHLRSVATDRNTATGPGRGVSSTRQIRVVREGDEMQVDALVGFPLEAEREPVLSQRMILLMTEDLLGRAPLLHRDSLSREAVGIAREQARLRGQVAEQVFSRATGAMEPTTRHLGDGLHTHGDDHAHAGEPPVLDGLHRHEEDAADEGRLEAELRPGSRYGVAAIFDPSSEGRMPRHHDEEARSGEHPDLLDPTRFDAGTGVGRFTVGGPGEMPTGFGVLPELGHDHDGDPILSVNRPLLEIHNAMWESERQLRLAALRGSIPFQEEALAGLQALRENERVFPRGTVTAPPVDVAGVRGTGDLDEAAPADRSPGEARRGTEAEVGRLERILGSGEGPEMAEALTRLAVELLGDPTAPERAGLLVARAANLPVAGGAEVEERRRLIEQALEILDPAPVRAEETAWTPAPSSALAAAVGWREGDGDGRGGIDGGREDVDDGRGGGPGARAAPETGHRPETATSPEPFVFATLRYESGNWDSAPLVPQNLIHSLAQYTDLPLEPEGVFVDLDSPEIHAHPVLYLTGHLPVRFSQAEARNLEAYVRRGGFVFMDDHNHDIDGAFHRTATAELARIFGEDALQPLPNDHELYRSFFHFEDGPPTTSHELSGWGDGLIHPELHAVLVDGRIGVLYSNKDYSSEWNYHAVNKRFLAVDNTRFGVNILVYALTR